MKTHFRIVSALAILLFLGSCATSGTASSPLLRAPLEPVVWQVPSQDTADLEPEEEEDDLIFSEVPS